MFAMTGVDVGQQANDTSQFQQQPMTSDLCNAGERSATKCKGNSGASLSGSDVCAVVPTTASVCK